MKILSGTELVIFLKTFLIGLNQQVLDNSFCTFKFCNFFIHIIEGITCVADF